MNKYANIYIETFNKEAQIALPAPRVIAPWWVGGASTWPKTPPVPGSGYPGGTVTSPVVPTEEVSGGKAPAKGSGIPAIKAKTKEKTAGDQKLDFLKSLFFSLRK